MVTKIDRLEIKSGRLYNRNKLIRKDENGYCFLGEKKFVYQKLFEHIKRITNPEPEKLVAKTKVKVRVPKIRKRKNYTANHRKKKVVVSCPCGSCVERFESHTAAAKYLKVSRSFVSNVVSGRKKTVHGFFVKEEIIQASLI